MHSVDSIRAVTTLVPLLLASLVALANLIGPIRATKEHGYSVIPFLSLVFCGLAYVIAPPNLRSWVFLPAAFDLGNWVLVYSAFDFAFQSLKRGD